MNFRVRYFVVAAIAVLVVPFLFPERRTMPVVGAMRSSWHPKSFWYEPWGRSGVHKGIDIFAKMGTPVLAPIDGIVVFAGEIKMGGTVVMILGPKYRLHYLAHLQRSDLGLGRLVTAGTPVGTVGDSGNAKGKPPHLHYAIVTLAPYPWRFSSATQGWKKMLFLDPSEWLPRRTHKVTR